MASKKRVPGIIREAVKVTAKQQKLLVQLLMERPNLGIGKVDKSFTNLDRKKGWQEISHIMNASGHGPTKTVQKWAKCWSDLKSKIKVKKAIIDKTVKPNGEGQGTAIELTSVEEQVLSEFLSDSVVSRDDNNVDEATVPLAIHEASEVVDGQLQLSGAVHVTQECFAEIPETAIVTFETGLLIIPEVSEQQTTSVPTAEVVEVAAEEASSKSVGTTSDTVKKRRRDEATEKEKAENLSEAKRLTDQLKTSQTLTYLSISVDRIANASERRTIAEERRAMAEERRALAEERRALAEERRSDTQTAIMQRFAAAVEKLVVAFKK